MRFAYGRHRIRYPGLEGEVRAEIIRNKLRREPSLALVVYLSTPIAHRHPLGRAAPAWFGTLRHKPLKNQNGFGEELSFEAQLLQYFLQIHVISLRIIENCSP